MRRQNYTTKPIRSIFISCAIILSTIIILALMTPPAMARGKFWISNKLEVGYNKAFISNQVRFDRNEFIRNSLAAGLRFKVSNTTNFKTFYLLENARKNNWNHNHFLGAQFELKLQ